MGWQPGDGYFWQPETPAEGFTAEDRELDADVVIIGTGPGGAAAARVLSGGGMRVVMLEEGPARERFRPNQSAVMRYHMQEGGAMVATGRTYMPIASGRGVGGGTLINSAIAWRCPDEVLDSWTALLGDARFSAANMRPVYDWIWEYLGIWETLPGIAGENNDLIVRGVRKLGWEGGYLSRYTPRCVGCGTCFYGCGTGGKSSMNHNFLVEAQAAGVRILAETKVVDVLVASGRAAGVVGQCVHPETGEPGGKVTVRAPKVIVAAGGIGTPRFLHGISTPLGPAVGRGLHTHPGNAVFGVCKHEVNWWKGATQGAWCHVPDLPGVLPHSSTLPPEVAMLALAALGIGSAEAIRIMPHLVGLLVLVSDKSSGSVGRWPDGRANIRYDFLDSDVERIKAGMVAGAKVLLAGGADWLFCAVGGVGRVWSAEELEVRLRPATIRDFTLYASHPMSTCRMGTDPETSVVRPDGRAHALEGLYLSDASVFPTSLGVNPSITTMAMSTIISQGILHAG